MPDLIRSAWYDKREDLPEELVVGCKYFIKNEGVVLVNHGNGDIAEYGSKIKSKAPANGKLYGIRNDSWEKVPDTELQDQLNDLSEAGIQTSISIAEIKQDIRDMNDVIKGLNETIDNLSKSLNTLKQEVTNLKNA